MKRLCLMALSLLMLSFNAFAQVEGEKGLIGGGVQASVVVIGMVQYGTFPTPIPAGSTAVCQRDASLDAKTTYRIEGRLDLNGHNLNCSGANIILVSGGSIVNTSNSEGKIKGANIFCETGTTINYNDLTEGCTMFARTNEGMATTIASEKWNFIGLFDNTNLTAFGSVSNANNRVWALQYDYENGNWGSEYCTYDNTFDQGEGVFVYPENQTTVLFTVNPITEDVRIHKTVGIIESERSSKAPSRYLYHGWVALSNPFVESIYVSRLVSEITPEEQPHPANFQSIQGGCVYTYNGVDWTPRTSGSILPGQGFFLYLQYGEENAGNETNNAIFDLKHDWVNQTSSSSKAASRDFLTLSVATNGYKVPVMFAQNDQATEEYDIFDANKLFGDGSVAEPYLVCNGIELCKEEVNSENYTATMNIKSFESRSVEIVADNIPEGYSLTLLDGAVEVEMSEGDVYTTDITEGENADRFKLLINKNNVSIADVAQTESVRVVNNNRSIAIYGGKNVRTEVYNALGQKVYETSDRTFDLNNVAAGAYVLKVQDGKSVSSSKIIVR